MGTADAKLASQHVYNSNLCAFVVNVLWGDGCASQDQKSLFERDPLVLGNFEISTQNLVH